VREFVARYGGAAGLPARRVRNLQLAANELATNAIAHGGGTGELRVWQTERQVLCEVRDPGRARNRLAGLVPPGPDALGGRGLPLVNHLSDLVRIHTGPHGTAIRVYVDRAAGNAPP
jgi:anti-sigma regulatory factor (Ser/Thr protein kinase)